MFESSPKPVKKQNRLISFLLSKDVPPIPLPEERTVYPERNANPLSWIFFWWLNPMLKVGYKRTLQAEDMFYLQNDQKLEYIYPKFRMILDAELAKQQAGKPSHDVSVRTLCLALYKTFWFEYTTGAMMKVLSDVATTLSPLLQKALTNFVEAHIIGTETSYQKGIGYSIGCCLMILFIGVTMNHFFYRSMLVGAKCKAVLTRLLLDKSFRMDSKGNHDFPSGKINSILGTDLNRIDFAIGYIPMLFTLPIPIIISIAILIVNIGVSSLAGIAIFLVTAAIFLASIRSLMKIRSQTNKFTDKRVSLMKELLKDFKMVKLYSWEVFYGKKITDTRKTEMHFLLKLQNIRNNINALGNNLPIISSMVSFCVLYALDSNRSVGDIFSSLTLFQVLAQQFMMIPLVLALTTDLIIGMRRVCGLISCGEVPAEGEPPEPLNEEGLAVKVSNGGFMWQDWSAEEESSETDVSIVEKAEEDEHDLKSALTTTTEKRSHDINSSFPGLWNVNLSVKKGELVIITGSIGSGKSSLLNALAGFMPKKSGRVQVDGSLLLCGYPWIQNATIRSNITFGLPFDGDRYYQVIEACSLGSDLQQWPGGDMTEVGERGVTLSGGQKARVNLARAVYAEKDIILLDDVLSAVDAKVGKHIMDKCILGLLGERTRIMATHQLSILPFADKVIFLNGDGSMSAGTMNELLESNEQFRKLMALGSHEGDRQEEQNKIEEEVAELKKIATQQEFKLIEKEQRAVNRIKGSVVKMYLRLGSGKLGVLYLPLFITVMTLATFCSLFTSNWLAFWQQQRFAESPAFYIGIYVMISMLSVVFLTLEYVMLVHFCNTASKKLNIMATERVVHSPMSFVETSPIGRILNRFTKDTDVLDNDIVQQIRMFFKPFSTIVGTVILCVIYLPWFALAIPILVFLYVLIAEYYQSSAREVKRLDSLQRSIVFSHFNEMLEGMPTIKAYKEVSRCMLIGDERQDRMNEAYFLTIANQRWLAVNLDLVATLLALIVCLLCCFRIFGISAEATGLLLSYVMNIANMLSMMLKSLTQVENEMNSVERLNYYATELDQESAYEIPERNPSPDWPQRGAISFRDVRMKYRPGLPYVLKGLTIDIKPGEKLGICGRTGAGKSTLMLCLYRLVEPEGNIYIDGVDIKTLGLHKLRSKLSIIPQDPVLFIGSIRENIDPFKERKDDVLWGAMVRSGLINKEDLPGVLKQKNTDPHFHKFHLDRMVEDDGANFSLGERQLLALARALVRDTKILIMDEATSSVDYNTDAKVQNTISKEFSDCTVLCIAHRLRTILSHERIIVMDKGVIAESGKPLDLFNNQESIFRSACDQSGITEDDFISQ
ncbi:DEKNAAC104893 [Brettanomyces naardenensis]|uniref:DEKNAAC104893 n=1 Tax=Brettanomyces naardenensis TaxID=13370 RepID=A0A448YS52_BRENA|nr:DEKNAAC104893 [Brettanomyces naardenensis]